MPSGAADRVRRAPWGVACGDLTPVGQPALPRPVRPGAGNSPEQVADMLAENCTATT